MFTFLIAVALCASSLFVPRFSQGAFDRPAFLEANIHKIARPAAKFCPLTRRPCLAIESNKVVSAGVPVLLLGSRPTDVSRFIVSIPIGEAVDATILRTHSTIGEEVFKDKPPLTHRNSSPSIQEPFFVVRIRAAILDVFPYRVFPSPTFSMRGKPLPAHLIFETSAAFGVAINDHAGGSNLDSSALALNFPISNASFTNTIEGNESPAIETSACQIFSARTGLGLLGIEIERSLRISHDAALQPRVACGESREDAETSPGLFYCTLPTNDMAIQPGPGPPKPTDEDRAAAGEVSMAFYMHQVCQTHRANNGLFRQRLDDDLTLLAQTHANWMAANNNMQHGQSEQIIAMGQATPEDAMNAWMNSSGHRFWMLSGTTRAGWGCARAANGTLYWAGCFRNDPAPVVEGAVANTESSGTINYSNSGRRRLFRFRR